MKILSEKIVKHSKITVVLILLLSFMSACAAEYMPVNQQIIQRRAFLMDTLVSINVFYNEYGFMVNPANYEEIAVSALNIIASYEELFSMFIEDSDIWRINNAGGEPVVVSDETISVLNEAMRARDLTNGHFDITIGAVSALWQEARLNGIPPDPALIAEALESVGAEIFIDGNTVQLGHPQTQLDLGGVAKGYVARRAAQYFDYMGIAGTIDLGGDTVTVGEKPDGTLWNIGILSPFTGDTFAILHVEPTSIVTSGTYQRFFEYNGEFFHHIIDPQTGSPAEGSLISVTAITDDTTIAEAFSTAVFMMEPQDALDLAESIPGLEVVFIFVDGSHGASSGIGDSVGFTLIQNP